MGMKLLSGARRLRTFSAICGAVLLSHAHAQFRGDHLPGFTGLQNGTQAPPGLYAGNVVFVYPTDTIKDNRGHDVPLPGKLTTAAEIILVSVVGNQKVLGGNIGGSVAFPFIKDRLQANSFDVDTGLAYTDMFAGVSLGWHLKRADVMAGYNAYMSTGTFTGTARNNTGLGMWGNEVTLGTTVFFDEKKTWHAAATYAAEFHTEKENTGITVGDVGTVEYGIGKTLYKKGAGPIPTIFNVGASGYAQFKMSEDNGPGVPLALRGLKDRVFALGPEFSVFMPGPRLTFLVRYEPEFGARNRAQGQTVVISLAWVAKSFLKPPPAH
jgi:hypothetical protein